MKGVIISVAIPVLALLGWVATVQYSIAASSQIRVRVQGYDPRDLLAGHYIRFTLKLGEQLPCGTSRRSAACVCFSPDADGVFHSPSWAGACAYKPRNCAVFVSGVCDGSRFEAGTERYSIPERLAPVLQTVPPDSSITLATDSAGRAHVLGFYAGEELLESYAERKLAEQKSMPESDSQ